MAQRVHVLARSVLFLVLALALSAAQAQTEDKNVVVHIGQYSNDLHSMTMGLGLADNLQKQGATVTVFLDREAVRIADRGQPFLVYGDTDTQGLMEAFLEGGGKVVICPHCAELGGVERSELRDGMTMGTMASVAALFMAADLVIDY
ncbi:MAG: DsrE family protein [Pseudomonadales bacterium]|nr:DsrE family protein [Pseudomonadales bacterium]